MAHNDDHIERMDDDPSRTLDATAPLHAIGSSIGSYKLLSVLGEGGLQFIRCTSVLDR